MHREIIQMQKENAENLPERVEKTSISNIDFTKNNKNNKTKRPNHRDNIGSSHPALATYVKSRINQMVGISH